MDQYCKSILKIYNLFFRGKINFLIWMLMIL